MFPHSLNGVEFADRDVTVGGIIANFNPEQLHAIPLVILAGKNDVYGMSLYVIDVSAWQLLNITVLTG